MDSEQVSLARSRTAQASFVLGDDKNTFKILIEES